MVVLSVKQITSLSGLLFDMEKGHRTWWPFDGAPRTGFEPVTSRLTAGCSQKHRSVDVEQLRKPFHVSNNRGSAKKLFGHNCKEPVAQCFQAAVYHVKQYHSNSHRQIALWCKSQDSEGG